MNTLIKKIEEVKSTHHMDNSDLSRALGYADHYITRVLREGRSTATQERLIAEIDTWISNLNADSAEYVLKAYHDQEVAKLKAANNDLDSAVSKYREIHKKLKAELNTENSKHAATQVFLNNANRDLESSKNTLKKLRLFSIADRVLILVLFIVIAYLVL